MLLTRPRLCGMMSSAETLGVFRDSRQVSELKGNVMTKSAPKSALKAAPVIDAKPDAAAFTIDQANAMERFRKAALAVKSAAVECVRFACAMIDSGVHTARGEPAITTILSLAKSYTDSSTAYYIRDLAAARLASPAAFEAVASKSLDAVRQIATRSGSGTPEEIKANLESVAVALKADPALSAKDAISKAALLNLPRGQSGTRPTGTALAARLAKCAYDGSAGNYAEALKALRAAIEQIEREAAHADRVAKSA